MCPPCSCRPQGLRPQWPPDCFPHLEYLGKRCIAHNPADRPTFTDIVKELEDMEVMLRELLQVGGQGVEGHGQGEMRGAARGGKGSRGRRRAGHGRHLAHLDVLQWDTGSTGSKLRGCVGVAWKAGTKGNGRLEGKGAATAAWDGLQGLLLSTPYIISHVTDPLTRWWRACCALQATRESGGMNAVVPAGQNE